MAESHYKARILVVDDEKLIRLTISAKLKKAGYDCVAVGTVEEAVAELKKAPTSFSAVITDIMMGEMDGFVFRDIVRGIDPKMPMFFLTALDPEEGSGFLRRILDDAISYYLPKAVDTETLLNRVRQVVASHRVEVFIQKKIDEDRKSLELASQIQRSLMPVRAVMTPRGFYSMYWHPFDIVSGDIFEAFQFGAGRYLYVLGDIQGHGTGAALAMTAVQSFLKHLMKTDGIPTLGPEAIANRLQKFFRANLADISYMTALICIHSPLLGNVKWISCGAPDLLVMDGGKDVEVNPEHRGGVPIGMLPDTIYSPEDVVETPLERSAVCVGFTDGLLDLSQDKEGEQRLSIPLSRSTRLGIVEPDRRNGACMASISKYMKALSELGYDKFHDDVTIFVFGAAVAIPGIYEATIRILPEEVDRISQETAQWCREQNWPDDLVSRIQLVLEEKLMNIHDHGFDERDRLLEVVSMRLRRVCDDAELTIWDTGSKEPSIAVVAGDADTAFELKNKEFSGRGRGRLIVREICNGIERNFYPPLNETTYHIPFFGKESEDSKTEGGGAIHERMLQGVPRRAVRR